MGKQEQHAANQIGRFWKIITGGVLSAVVFTGCTTMSASNGKVPRWGEFGGNMRVLQAALQGPQHPGESNFYLDLMGMSLRPMVSSLGLTNNHALFVLSHGRAVPRGETLRYAFYGGKQSDGWDRKAFTWWNKELVSYYSAADLARVMGDKASQVQVVVLAGCNTEDMFYPQEFKHYFENLTTIIHATPKTDASVITFRDLLTYNSAQLGNQKVSGTHFSEFGKPNTQAMGPYVAEIFRPGSSKPFRQQVAGREFLTGSSAMQMVSSGRTNASLSGLEPTGRD